MKPEPAETCAECHEQICPHGLCWCADKGDGACHKCADRQQLAWEADREAAFQRDVIGPMFGWREDE